MRPRRQVRATRRKSTGGSRVQGSCTRLLGDGGGGGGGGSGVGPFGLDLVLRSCCSSMSFRLAVLSRPIDDAVVRFDQGEVVFRNESDLVDDDVVDDATCLDLCARVRKSFISAFVRIELFRRARGC